MNIKDFVLALAEDEAEKVFTPAQIKEAKNSHIKNIEEKYLKLQNQLKEAEIVEKAAKCYQSKYMNKSGEA